MQTEYVEKSRLLEFLIKAKQNSYAKHGTRVESKCILSKNYLYTDTDFRYEDQYFGEFIDVGEEIVWYHNIPIWGMGYRGGIFEEYHSIREETFIFLRKALMMPLKDFPTRGPSTYEEHPYTYVNKSIGDIFSFTGKEIIKKDDIQVYERNYVGGLIKGKASISLKIIERGSKGCQN